MTESSFYHEAPCRLFTHAVEGNTKAVLEAVARQAEELSIGKILVATCSGVTGFAKPDFQEMPAQKRREEVSNHGK